MTAPGRVRGMSVSPAGHVERLELGSGLESAGAARRFTAASLVDICTEELVDVAMLLVSELATNALRHAVPPYALTLDIHLPRIEISVCAVVWTDFKTKSFQVPSGHGSVRLTIA